MINIDKILGSVVQSVVTGALSTVVSKRSARKAGSSVGRAVRKADKRALGTGALGIAIAAYEHFKTTPSGEGEGGRATPPPPPPAGPAAVPAAPSIDSELSGSPEALVLLRTMVAAASADGVIDATERNAIVSSLAQAGLNAAESTFVDREFAHPRSIEELVASARSTETAEQMYTVGLLAVTVDTEAERRFLELLQTGLGLDDATVERIEASLN